MSVPDWLLIALGLAALVVVFAFVGHWFPVVFIISLVVGLAIATYA